MSPPDPDFSDLERQLQLALQRAERFRLSRDTAEKLLEQKSTELYQSNEALRASQENLQQDIAQATYELQASNDRLQAALDEKSTFIGALSHELRTPLNAVIGLSELLLKSPLNELQNDYATTIFESASSLTKLINSVLDISKIEAGKVYLHPAPTNCIKVIHTLKKMFALEAQQQNTQLVLDINNSVPQSLMLDEGRYAQLVTNLLSNAIKNTTDGQITISLRCKPNPNKEKPLTLITTVTDTGVGIAPEQIDRIFKAYEQFGNLHQGVGLGLAICEHITSLMQGQIDCKSEVGAGSQFTISVPTHECTAAQPQTRPAPSASDFESLRILLAEDNPINQKVLMAQFAQFELTPTIVNNGQQAVDLLQTSHFDVVFLDIQMPVLDGEQALHWIRTELAEHQYCVALTAASSSHKREALLSLGFDDFLSKPLILNQLQNALARFVETQSLALNHQQTSISEPTQQSSNNFDMSFLQSQFGDAADDILEQLAPIFLAHSYAEMADLHVAVENQKPSQVRKLSHSLKGALASIGMTELAALFEELEQEPEHPDLSSRLSRVTGAMADLKVSLEQVLAGG